MVVVPEASDLLPGRQIGRGSQCLDKSEERILVGGAIQLRHLQLADDWSAHVASEQEIDAQLLEPIAGETHIAGVGNYELALEVAEAQTVVAEEPPTLVRRALEESPNLGGVA